MAEPKGAALPMSPERARDRDRERAAIIGVALAALPREREIRRAWLTHHDIAFPEVTEALATLGELTDAGRRVSQRTLTLNLLAKGAHQRGEDFLAATSDSLHPFARSAVQEGYRLLAGRVAQERGLASRLHEALGDHEAVVDPAQLLRPVERVRLEAGDLHEVRQPAVERIDQAVLDANLVGPVGRTVPALHLPAAGGAMQVEALVETKTTITSKKTKQKAPPADPGPDTGAAARQVVDGLTQIATADDDGTPPWTMFASSIQAALNLTDAEMALPLCDDDEAIEIDGHTAYRVSTVFWSPLPASRFANWTDPRRWHLDCNLFYESVTPDQKIAANAKHFTEKRFTEVVRFTPTKTLTTPLSFSRIIDTSVPSEPCYTLTFHLPYLPEPKASTKAGSKKTKSSASTSSKKKGTTTTKAAPKGAGGSRAEETTADIHFDTGSICVQEYPDGLPSQLTRLQADKTILFTDPAMAQWPTLACDLFWMEFTITAALGCANDQP